MSWFKRDAVDDSRREMQQRQKREYTKRSDLKKERFGKLSKTKTEPIEENGQPVIKRRSFLKRFIEVVNEDWVNLKDHFKQPIVKPVIREGSLYQSTTDFWEQFDPHKTHISYELDIKKLLETPAEHLDGIDLNPVENKKMSLQAVRDWETPTPGNPMLLWKSWIKKLLKRIRRKNNDR